MQEIFLSQRLYNKLVFQFCQYKNLKFQTDWRFL
nr:MAG TPA: hypothetical protein [Caudoviricetes sp.]